MTSSDRPSSPTIGLFTAASIIVASTIGTGVFTSLGFQAVEIRSGFALLLLWVVGGVFALCGALCYGELGAAMPRSGGECHYLSEIYHPAVGFLAGWISVTVGFAAPIATTAMAFGDYISRLVPVAPVPAALAIALIVTLVHLQGLELGGVFQDASTALKILSIVALIGCGLLLVTAPQNPGFLPQARDVSLVFSAPFAVSLVYVTYSYSGWNASVYLASEVRSPEKNLPRSLLLGTAIVMVLYLLLNFVFLYSTPLDALAGQLEVGYIAADRIFGSIGAKVMTLAIALGLISSISSMSLAGPRVAQVIGEDIPLFRLLARKNARGTPLYAILLQLTIVVTLILTATFDTVVTYLGFTLTLSSCLTVLGVFVHRVRYPDAPRPYRTWGYPITPIIFIAISVWILYFILQDKPAAALAGVGTIALGLPIYIYAANNRLANSDRS